MSGTGATEAQIERAAFAFYRNPNLTPDDYGEYAEWAMGEARRFASHLVPEGMVIARAADVLTPELRAAMARAMSGTSELRAERIAEWVYEALRGFFDFGEDGANAADDHCWEIARHVGARFNPHVVLLGTDEQADLTLLRAAATGGAE